MTKEDKRRYDRMINDIADRLMIDANREAFKVTALHMKIEQYFKDHQQL